MEKLKGIVIKSTGSWYKVLTEDGKEINCKIKGKFRLDNLKSTNPVAVGDKVHFHFDDIINYAVIDKIEDRKNFLVRKSPNLSRQSHIIATNLDYTIIISTLWKPQISTAFVDRFLVISQAYEIEPVIVYNKIDILEIEQKKKLEELIILYTKLGFHCIPISAKTGENIESLKEIMAGKICLFAGQSGVGKSTILNKIMPGLNLKTKKISGHTGKGQHTTSYYEMHKINNNTFVIDSPGIRELGLFDFEAFEIGLFFPEFKKFAANCKFNTCLHKNEPGCDVKRAVEGGNIIKERYINYLKILEDFG